MKTHIEIHAGNLLGNLQLFKNITGSKIMFVVKANAYGHGLREVIQITKASPLIDHYAVDSLAEALTIRSLQSQKPVLVLGWTDPEELTELVANGFETVVPSDEHFRLLKRISKKLKRKALIHLKIETGTNRLGIDPEKAVSLLAAIGWAESGDQGHLFPFCQYRGYDRPGFCQAATGLVQVGPAARALGPGLSPFLQFGFQPAVPGNIF